MTVPPGDPRRLLQNLAGPSASIEETSDDFEERPAIVTIQSDEVGLMVRGSSPDDAVRRALAMVGQLRVLASLPTMGWTDVDDFIDEASFIVGRDPSGVMWGIGVDSDADQMAWLLDQIRLESFVDRAIVIDPAATENVERLEAALGTR